MTEIKTLERGNLKVTIYNDDTMESPRAWDNLGTMICFHNRYDLGDKHSFKGPEDFKQEIKPDKNLIMPLYLYDHSGITISTSSFNDRFDSGQVGYIYVSYQDIKKEYKNISKAALDTAKKVLLSEVETYDQYLTGEIYSYSIEKADICKCCKHKEFVHIDSCSGFYGLGIDNGMLDHVSNKKQNALLLELLKSI